MGIQHHSWQLHPPQRCVQLPGRLLASLEGLSPQPEANAQLPERRSRHDLKGSGELLCRLSLLNSSQRQMLRPFEAKPGELVGFP